MYNAQNGADPLRPLNGKSLAGKIMRVDREGRGLASHPFCPADTDLTHACTKIYAQGFRNPFRFGLATRGGVWAGDVGESLWEEFDHVTPGASYGWPCLENQTRNAAFQGHSLCQATYAAGQQKPPVWAYAHGQGGACIIVGPEIRSSRYPASWQGSVLVGDIVTGELNRVEVDNAGKVVAIHPFATDWKGADLRIGPDGYIYSADFWKIDRFVPAAGNRPPEARATVTPYAGLAPLEAHFDGSASSDPDGDALTYQWTFGDGTAATGPTPIHTYATNGRFTARLTVTDAGGLSSTAEVPVVVGTRMPEITFVKPAADFRFRAGEPVDLEVTATDPEDGTLPDNSISWLIILQHNQHQHSIGSFSGRTANFTPLRSHDADSYYLIDVTATDSEGVSTTKHLRLNPKTVRLELAVDPAVPAEITYDGAPHATPMVKDSTVGFETTIAAPTTVKAADGKTLVFTGWSDGGAATHAITIPDADTRLVARYREDATPPETWISSGPSVKTRDHNPTFYFYSDEPTGFECRMDAGPWTWCKSPWRWPQTLSNKSHTFEVRAIDAAGNADPTPASNTFLVIP
jgi:PKD repeat protein